MAKEDTVNLPQAKYVTPVTPVTPMGACRNFCRVASLKNVPHNDKNGPHIEKKSPHTKKNVAERPPVGGKGPP